MVIPQTFGKKKLENSSRPSINQTSWGLLRKSLTKNTWKDLHKCKLDMKSKKVSLQLFRISAMFMFILYILSLVVARARARRAKRSISSSRLSCFAGLFMAQRGSLRFHVSLLANKLENKQKSILSFFCPNHTAF